MTSACAVSAQSRAAASAKHNILYIMADDLNADWKNDHVSTRLADAVYAARAAPDLRRRDNCAASRVLVRPHAHAALYSPPAPERVTRDLLTD